MLNSYDAEQYILATSSAIWKIARMYYEELPEQPPKIVCSSEATKYAGVAYFNLTKGIKYNLAFICSMENHTEFDRTIAHELAHVIQFRLYPRAKQAHGPEFRAIMLVLGYNGSTYHSYSVSKAKSIAKSLQQDDLLKELGIDL